MRPGSFEFLPDGRLAVGTRRGDIYFITGALDSPPDPKFHLFASGQDEIFGLSWRDGSLTATQFGEVTKITDTDGDGTADRFDTLTNNWGYAEGHEFALRLQTRPRWQHLGRPRPQRLLQLQQPLPRLAVKVTPDGRMIPVCSGLRSPGGVAAQCRRSHVHHRKPGAVERLLLAQTPKTRRLPRPPRQLQLVPVRRKPRHPRRHTRLQLPHPRRKTPRQRTRPPCRPLPLHQNGPLHLRLPPRRHRRKIRPLQKPAVLRRLHPQPRHARHHRKDQRRLAGRLLPPSAKASPPAS